MLVNNVCNANPNIPNGAKKHMRKYSSLLSEPPAMPRIIVRVSLNVRIRFREKSTLGLGENKYE